MSVDAQGKVMFVEVLDRVEYFKIIYDILLTCSRLGLRKGMAGQVGESQ